MTLLEQFLRIAPFSSEAFTLEDNGKYLFAIPFMMDAGTAFFGKSAEGDPDIGAHCQQLSCVAFTGDWSTYHIRSEAFFIESEQLPDNVIDINSCIKKCNALLKDAVMERYKEQSKNYTLTSSNSSVTLIFGRSHVEENEIRYIARQYLLSNRAYEITPENLLKDDSFQISDKFVEGVLTGQTLLNVAIDVSLSKFEPYINFCTAVNAELAIGKFIKPWLRRMYETLVDSNAKTVSICLCVDGISITFDMKTETLLNCCIATAKWDRYLLRDRNNKGRKKICDVIEAKFNKLGKLFQNGSRIYTTYSDIMVPDNISKITYRKKVIYQKEEEV